MIDKNKINEIVDNLMTELKRGTIVLSVLSQLEDAKYGYSLVQTLEEKGFAIDAGTLYPLMRRLEAQELLASNWETTGNKPRKYYVISETGKMVFERLSKEWNELNKKISILLNNGGK